MNTRQVSSADASYANAKNGTGTFATTDYFAGVGIVVGQSLDTGVYESDLGFWEYDATQLVASPLTSLYVWVQAPIDKDVTLHVAQHSFTDPPTGSDWLTPTALAGLTSLASRTFVVGSDGYLEIPAAGLTFGAAIQFVFWTSDQQNSVAPTLPQERCKVAEIFARTAYSNPGSVGSYATEVAADSPSLWWRLDEPSGTTASDNSGHSHPGTYTNSPTLTQPGLVGDSDKAITVSFSSNSYVVSTTDFNGLDFSSAGLTIEFVATVNDLADFPTVGGFFSGVQCGIEAWDNGNSSTEMIFALFYETSIGALFILDQGTPTHIVGCFPNTGDENTKVVIVNGDVWQTIHPDNPTFTTNFGGTANFYAGGNGTVGNSFDGTLDEPAFYPTKLSVTRSQKHAKAAGLGGGGGGLVSLSETLTDAIGIRNVLTVIPTIDRIYSVTKPDYCQDPSYSPDGTKIIFVEKLGSNYNLSRITTSGASHAVLLTNTTQPYFDPTYSADGKYVLFSQQTAAPSGGHTYGDWAIKYIDPSNVVHTIVSDTNANMHPVWLTPTQVAFQRLRYGTDSTFHIVLADLAGTVITDIGVGEYPRLVVT